MISFYKGRNKYLLFFSFEKVVIAKPQIHEFEKKERKIIQLIER